MLLILTGHITLQWIFDQILGATFGFDHIIHDHCLMRFLNMFRVIFMIFIIFINVEFVIVLLKVRIELAFIFLFR